MGMALFRSILRSKKVKRTVARRKFVPSFEWLEDRRLLATGAFLQGYAFSDISGDGHFESGEGLQNATITLYASNGTTQLAQTTTDANGYYRFDDSNVSGGLSAGTYFLVETTPPSGFTGGPVDILSQLDPASATTLGGNNAIHVTIIDPAHIHDTFDSFGLGHTDDPTFQGNPDPGFTGQLNVHLTGPGGFRSPAGSGSFVSYCVDLFNSVSPSSTFAVLPTPDLTGLTNGAEIAYLYNHYGISTPLGDPAHVANTADSAEALQEAIWKLQYDGQFTPDFHGSTTVQNDYNFYLSDAQGKNEAAIFLDATLGGTIGKPGHGTINAQGMLVTQSFNFGNVTAPTSSLAGTVYVDVNNNGVLDQPPDIGLGGQPVNLTGTDIHGNPVNLNTTTDSSGNYSFSGLVAGTYTVTENGGNGYGEGASTAGTSGGTATTDVISSISLGSGVNATGYNFGEVTGSLAGTVYVDVNQNNTLDQPPDTGLGGQPVTLTGTDVNGNAVNLSTTTASDGTYSFNGLLAGTYTVTENGGNGYGEGASTAGTSGGTATTDVISSISLGGGVNATGYNFGEITGSLAGTVYVDVNQNNTLDQPPDTGLGGQLVVLTGTDVNGNAVNLSTTTASNGTYSFSGLLAGTYTVTENGGNGYGEGASTAGTSGGTATTDVISGISLSGGVNAIGYNFGEVTGSLAGTVYVDVNNNGGLDQPPDTGLGGQPVALTGTDVNGNAVNLSTTTASDGTYIFSGLIAGTYTVTENGGNGYGEGASTAGTSGGTATTDVISAISLGGGVNATGYNFGEVTGSLAGTVYVDVNNNGALDQPPDTGLGGQPVALTGTDVNGNPVNLSTTTAADGTYSFSGLVAGTYTVTENGGNGYGEGASTAGTSGGTATTDVVSGISLGGGVNASGYNFGEVTGSLTGTVYVDVNNNGVLDQPPDTGLGGQPITLTGTDVNGNPVNLSTTTASNGTYSFTGLVAGTYTVTENGGNGYGEGASTAGTSGGTATTDVISGISLGGGVNASGYNFGEVTGSLAGTVYVDVNNNGVLDQPPDTGLAGQPVTLTGTDVNGNPVNLSTTTAANGTYSFSGLVAGTYTVTENGGNGYGEGASTAGTSGGTATTDVISAISLGGGVNATAYNFGEVTGSLAGTVYVDVNNNGVLDQPPDTGLGGQPVSLTGTDVNGNAVSLTTTTASNGTYSFTGLVAGTYTVTENGGNGYGEGASTAGTSGGSDATDVISSIGLGGGVNATGYNFGEVTGSLAGTAYVDVNNNGVLDQPPDTGLAGQPVTLTGTDVNGNPVNLSTTTAANGTYSFSGLVAGTYTVTENGGNGYGEGASTAGTSAGTATTDVISAISLGGGVNATGYNFGEVTGSLAGTVYVDVNNNGVLDQPPDTGLGGQPVTLTGTDVNGNAVNLSTTTAANGTYTFSGLVAGTYTVTENGGNGYGEGASTAGTAGGTAAADVVSSISLGSGVNATGYNFGEVTGSLKGTVYVDVNQNGVFDSGDMPLAGVSVTLGGASSGSTMTDANGNYIFNGLLAGTYTVTEGATPGYAEGTNTPGIPTNGTVSGDVISAINLSGGSNLVHYDFGELTTAPPIAHGDAATIGFWHNKNGQALIKSLNGGPNSTALAQWLVTNFPNLFGPTAGNHKLATTSHGVTTYYTNAQVASAYNTYFFTTGTGPKTYAQILAAALAVYVTSSNLAGGTMASGYGFNVSANGIGSHTVNVGSNGAAFGVPNNTTLSVLQILLYTNSQSPNGNLYWGNTTLTNEANTVYDQGINSAGDITMLDSGSSPSAEDDPLWLLESNSDRQATTVVAQGDNSQGNVIAVRPGPDDDEAVTVSAGVGRLSAPLAVVSAVRIDFAQVMSLRTEPTDLRGIFGVPDEDGEITVAKADSGLLPGIALAALAVLPVNDLCRSLMQAEKERVAARAKTLRARR
jgi:hypothetical protein